MLLLIEKKNKQTNRKNEKHVRVSITLPQFLIDYVFKFLALSSSTLISNPLILHEFHPLISLVDLFLR